VTSLIRSHCQRYTYRVDCIAILRHRARESAYSPKLYFDGLCHNQARREEGKGEGEFSRATRRMGGPGVAQKYWKWCSRWLLSDRKYAKNPFSAGAPMGELTTLPRTPSRMVRAWEDTYPHVSSLDLKTYRMGGGDRGPRYVFPGPAVALDGPGHNTRTTMYPNYCFHRSLHKIISVLLYTGVTLVVGNKRIVRHAILYSILI